MAKPQHTAYQLQADFPDIITLDGVTTTDDIVGLQPSCIQGGHLQSVNRFVPNRNKKGLQFCKIEDAYISFGYTIAEKLLEQCRTAAKDQFQKGSRPTFFLRKLTMSEFMSHKQFKQYKDKSMIKTLYKKYLLLDLLK